MFMTQPPMREKLRNSPSADDLRLHAQRQKTRVYCGRGQEDNNYCTGLEKES